MKVSRLSRVLSTRAGLRLVSIVGSRSGWTNDRLAVLTYHRIDEVNRGHKYPGLVSATPSDFELQMKLVAREFNAVSVDELVMALRGEGELPERAVLLTFDDGVDDFERHAFPTLRRHGLPAAVFVPTAFVGDRSAVFWWDALWAAVSVPEKIGEVLTRFGPVTLTSKRSRRDAYQQLRSRCLELRSDEATEFATALCSELGVVPPLADVMGWDAMRQMDGVAFCAHSRTHAHLDHLDGEPLAAEIEGSIADLHAGLGREVHAFAYPAGRVSPEAVEVVRSAGVMAAFTTCRGTNRLGETDPFAFRRINVSRTTGIGMSQLQMMPMTDRWWN